MDFHFPLMVIFDDTVPLTFEMEGMGKMSYAGKGVDILFLKKSSKNSIEILHNLFVKSYRVNPPKLKILLSWG